MSAFNGVSLIIKFFITASVIVLSILFLPEYASIALSILLILLLYSSVSSGLKKAGAILITSGINTDTADIRDEAAIIERKCSSLLNAYMEQKSLADSLIHGIANPFVMVDKNSEITYINEAGAAMVGYSKDELIGRNIKSAVGSDAATRSTLAGNNLLNKKVTVKNHKKEDVPLILNTGAIKNSQGNVSGAFILFTDLREICEQQKQYLMEHTTNLSAVLESVAAGNLEHEVDVAEDDDLYALITNLNKTIKSLRSALIKVVDASKAVSSSAGEISASTEQMAAGAQMQSQQSMEISAAVEQLISTIVENTKNVNMTAEMTKRAGEKAREGGSIVNRTIEGMDSIAEAIGKSGSIVEKLGDSSIRIGEIIQVIDDIADQTNLLALNAAIEAARAGEQGRGFAVVADEVRKLAERTTKATKEITQMITQIQNETQVAVSSIKEGVDQVDAGRQYAHKSGEALEEIIQEADKSLQIAIQSASANEEMSASAEQISQNINSISGVIQQNAAGLEQISSATTDLNNLTVNLQELMSHFRLGSNGRYIEN
ncbi:MAG: methyl-accepting chemotaxis protein [Bacteroidota bacterium]